MKFNWDKIIGYCQGCSYSDYELTTFKIAKGYYKWFVDSKKGEPIAYGYGLTNKIAKQVAEITLQQYLEKREKNYEQINYGNYSFYGDGGGL